MDPILNRINPADMLELSFFKVRFNIILPSTPNDDNDGGEDDK
jgi:hypothetical protein